MQISENSLEIITWERSYNIQESIQGGIKFPKRKVLSVHTPMLEY